MARVVAANVVPPMFAPDPSTEESVLKYVNREQSKGSVLRMEKMNSDEKVNGLNQCQKDSTNYLQS